MERDFATPMKQAKEGLWLEAAKGLQQAYKGFGLYLIFLIYKKPAASGYLLITFIVLTVLVFIYSWFQYRSVRFYIDDEKDEFIFKSGVFTRNHIAIQIERIQQVNITRHVLQKLLNVYTVEVSTAGSQKTEVVIRAVKLQDAEALKRRLLRKNVLSETDTASPTVVEDATMRLSNASIFKIALTSRYGKSLALIFAFWATLYNAYRDVFRIEESGVDDTAEVALFNYLIQSTWFLVLGLLVFWVLFNIVTGFLRFYDYRLRIGKESIQVEYGSFKTNHVIVYPPKVQMVEVITNYLQRKMNLKRLILEQASSDIETDKKAKVEVPGATLRQVDEIIAQIFGQAVAGHFVSIQPNRRKLLKPMLRFIVIPFAIIFGFRLQPDYWLIILPVWVILVGVLSYFAFRHSRMMISDNLIRIQRGVWDISNVYLEPYKIQGVRVRQRLWHRRAGVAHVTLFTAAGNVTFEYAQLNDVNRYINKWLYQVETSEKAWM